MATISELRARFTATAQGFRQTIQGIQQDFEEVGDTGEQSADQANSGFSNLRNTLLGFAGAYLGFEAITGAVGGVVSITDEYQTALKTLATQTGATDAEMKGMEESLKNIYAGGYGENFTDIAQSMSLVERATGLTGKELETATQSAIALRDTFEYDVAESTRTADTMMRQFGISSDEAFELIAQGAQSGLDKHGDMMDSFNEYSVYFQQLGFDAEGMWNVFKSGAESGSFNMDKVGDAVKEFGIRVKDGSKTSAEAFQGLGMDADKMAQEFAKGGESSQLALQKTFEALGKIEDPVKRNTIGVALFGTQFEDLEHETVMALGVVQDQANMSGDAMDKINEKKFDNIGSAFEYLKRQVIVGLLDPIQKQVMPMINQFVNYMRENMPQIKGFIVGAFSGVMTIIQQLQPAFSNFANILMNVGAVVMPIIVGAIQGILAVVTPLLNGITSIASKFTEWAGFGPVVIGLATAIGTYMAIVKAGAIATALITNAVKLWTIAQRALNIVLNLNPIGIIIALLAGLVAGLIYAYQNSETFRNIVSNAWTMIKTVTKAVIDWFIATIPVWIENIKGWFTGLGNFLSNLWTGIKIVAMAIWNGLKTAVLAVINAFITAGKAYFNAYKTAIQTIFNALKTAVLAIWNALKKAVMAVINGWITIMKTVFNAYKTAVTTIFNALKTAVLAVWNALKTAVVSAVEWIKSKSIALFNQFKSNIVSIFNAVKSTVTSIVTGVKNAVVNGFNTAKNLAISAWNALKNGVTNAVNTVKSTVTGMKDKIISTIKGINLFQMGKDMIQGLINGIKNMAGKLVSSAKGVVDGAINGAKKLLGINSPSRVFMQFGEWTGEGLAIGLDKMKGMVEDATGTLTDASIGTINDAELNPMTATVETGQGGQGDSTTHNSVNIENYYQNTDTDARSLGHMLFKEDRNAQRKKGR